MTETANKLSPSFELSRSKTQTVDENYLSAPDQDTKSGNCSQPKFSLLRKICIVM